MNYIRYVETAALERFINSNGQLLTDLVKRWAYVYFPKCGVSESQYSINSVSFLGDGGVDGIINAVSVDDPLGFLDCKVVFQFKAGTTRTSQVRIELEKASEPEKERVSDLIKQGYKLIWIMGRAQTEPEVKAFERELANIVSGINPNAPPPVLIDANRLATCISRTPAIAAEIVSASGLFITSDQALKDTPHSLLPHYVPPAYFEGLKSSIEAFVRDSNTTNCVQYFAGEPGIGKSRAILEAVERIDGLSGLTCYFSSTTNLERFFTSARQYNWVGVCIVDDYIALATSPKIDPSTVPRGLKVLLIGHAFQTNRTRREYSRQIKPLDETEAEAVMRAAYPGLQAATRFHAIKLSKNNLRLANWLCAEMVSNPSEGLSAAALDRLVASELEKDASSQAAIRRLALVPLLLADDFAEFCELVGLEKATFSSACERSAQVSGFVQFNDNVVYITTPAIAQVALIRFWNEEQIAARRILSNPGKFFDAMLQSVNKLASGSEKEEMLVFFKLPPSSFSLAELLDEKTGRHFLQLLTAEPVKYLPQLYRLIKDNKEGLDMIPYQSYGIGRNDIIWKLRDLAQFDEYFEQCEEIVFWFAQKEISSPYSNVASSYWIEWFHAYFDFTDYPYEKRLDLLKQRIQCGDDRDHFLILSSISNPFPEIGMDIPSEVVGGRVAPPNLRMIGQRQITTAMLKVPDLLVLLLELGSPELRAKLGDSVKDASSNWFEHCTTLEPFLRIVQHPLFPPAALIELTVQCRYHLRFSYGDMSESQRKANHGYVIYRELLERIDSLDPIIDVYMLARHGFDYHQDGDELSRIEKRVIKRCTESGEFLDQVISVLNDPKMYSTWRIGKWLSTRIGSDTFQSVLFDIERIGTSPFALALINGYVSSHPEARAQVMDVGRRLEHPQPSYALALYQALGADTFLEESARMLMTSNISASFFSHVQVDVSRPQGQAVAAFLAAINRRLLADDKDSVGPAIRLALNFCRAGSEEESDRAMALSAFLKFDADYHQKCEYEWKKIANWLLSFYPREVISHCAKQAKNQYSAAIAALAEAAKQYSVLVLDALLEKLEKPDEPPFLLHGTFSQVLFNIDAAIFTEWLHGKPFGVVHTLAGQLPKPYLDQNGIAHLPRVTRAFWDSNPIGTPRVEDLLANFRIQTFNTGVFTGHGTELFDSRVAIAQQLLSDDSAIVRRWAGGFLEESDQELSKARKADAISDAKLDVDFER